MSEIDFVHVYRFVASTGSYTVHDVQLALRYMICNAFGVHHETGATCGEGSFRVDILLHLQLLLEYLVRIPSQIQVQGEDMGEREGGRDGGREREERERERERESREGGEVLKERKVGTVRERERERVSILLFILSPVELPI